MYPLTPLLQTSADFQFIDVWTSPFTWGGSSPPVAGDMVVVPAGQILLLDNSTERLSMVLIQGRSWRGAGRGADRSGSS